MKRTRLARLGLAVAVIVSIVVAQGAIGVSAKSASPILKGTIVIGQIASQTGAFSVYAQEQVQGFKAGLAYATNGTNKVDNARLVVKTYTDVPASSSTQLPDPATAVTDAKTALTSDNAQILQCCTSSASALAVAPLAEQYKKILIVAPANSDGLTGINRYTFRTSRMAYQDALTGAAYGVKKFGKNYATMAQDYAFGHSQVTAWRAVLDGKLHANDLGDVFFPLTATDYTPYIQQLLSKHAGFVVLICAGTQCTGLAKALDAAGVFDQTHLVTGLGNIASFSGYGDSGTKIDYLSVYYYKFPKTAANAWMVKYIQKNFNRPADIFDQDSFAAAQQLVAALKKTHSTSANKLIAALEGQTVQGPKGPYTIRKQDHACLQPMYIAQLVGSGTSFTAKLVKTLSPKQTAPPIQPHAW
jgi:branched-chain amino acid transport system substrate-binding protein